MSRQLWTYRDNEICCRRYIECCVLKNSGFSISAFARSLKQELPHLKENSIKRKISNIKYLSLEAKLDDSLLCAASSNYSADNRSAFFALLHEYKLI